MDAHAAAHAHPLQPALLVVQRLPARIVGFVARGAADPHVDVLEAIHDQALGLLTQVAGGHRAADLAFGDRQHGLAHITAHVEAAMQVVAALTGEVAAHLAQGADHFVPAVLRCQRPTAPGLRQRGIGSRPDQCRCRQVAHRQRAQAMQAVAGGVGHQHAAIGIQRQSAGAGQARQAAIADQRDLMALRRHLHDAAIEITHVQHAVMGGGQRQRPIDHATGGDHGADRTIGTHPAHGVVEQVGHQQRALRVEGQRHRRIEARSGAHAIGKARPITTGQGAHAAIRTDHPDAIVERIGHVNLALRIHGDAHRRIEAGLRGRAVGVALFATGQRGHLAIGADAADRMVAGVGHIQVALRVGGNARRRVETGLQCRAIDTSLALPGHRFNAAIGKAATDPVVVAGIGEIDAAIGTAQQRVRIGEACLRGRAITVTRVAIAGQRFNLRGPRQRRRSRTRRFSQRMQRCLPPGRSQCHYRRQRYACRHPLPPCHRAALPACCLKRHRQ